MLVGEEPGDQEDRQGHVFVGPAGRLLDRLLLRAGLLRQDLYLTNAVKHFKWKPAAKGKRRIHQKPSGREIAACRPWLLLEIARVQPRRLLLLGATAAQSLLGPRFRVTQQRGEIHAVEVAGRLVEVMATLHPSAVLRIEDGAERHRAEQAMVEELRRAAG
jgi:DNA polymerase